MLYRFVSKRQLSFIVSVGGRNRLVAFDTRNQAGVSAFMTQDEKVANAIRKHSLSRRGIIEETTVMPAEETIETVVNTPQVSKPETAIEPAVAAEPKERTYDNYTVARESICKEFGISKGSVRNPNTLAHVAKEHGIIIKYKEL